MTDRKQPSAAFWATVVFVVLMVYPLSFGPACWVSSRLDKGERIVSAAYSPVAFLMAGPLDRPKQLDKAIHWYAEYGAALECMSHSNRDQ